MPVIRSIRRSFRRSIRRSVRRSIRSVYAQRRENIRPQGTPYMLRGHR
jgi:hypothetical protein